MQTRIYKNRDMTQNKWPESLLLEFDLIGFFRVKDTELEQLEPLFNEAGESVPSSFLRETRGAKINNEDFTEIYEREIQKILKDIEGYDNPENRIYGRSILIEGIQNKINKYSELTKENPGKDRDPRLMFITKRFIEFICDMDKPETKEGLTDPTKTDNEYVIDSILKDMFKTINTEELVALKNNLRGGSKYLKLVYVGTKSNLWKNTGKLRQANIERTDIANVFAKCVKWQKTHSSVKEDLKYEELYSKILKE